MLVSRAAAKKRALVEAVPPPPVFDPFEDNLVCVLLSSRRVDGVWGEQAVGGLRF